MLDQIQHDRIGKIMRQHDVLLRDVGDRHREEGHQILCAVELALGNAILLIHRHPSARNPRLLRRKMYGAEYPASSVLRAQPTPRRARLHRNGVLELKTGKACLWFRHFPFALGLGADRSESATPGAGRPRKTATAVTTGARCSVPAPQAREGVVMEPPWNHRYLGAVPFCSFLKSPRSP